MKTQNTFSKRHLCLLVLIGLVSIVTQAQRVINATLQNDGRTRQYRLYVPSTYDANKPTPLILNFHGFTNNIEIQYNQSNFQRLAEENQFIFVTPQGLGGFFAGWAINNSFGGNADDLGFSDALIDRIQSEYNINEKRIYATGFSNGGFFSYRLACELSPRIAAVASVAGSMTRGWIDSGQCRPQHPTAVLQITGTRDNVIAISGNNTNEPIQDVMEYWADVNNADSTPDVIQLGGGSTRSIWNNGDNGVTAEFIRVQGKGHSWIGGNVNTSQEIWNFFSRFDIDGVIDDTMPPPPPSGCETLDLNNFSYTGFADQDIDGDFSVSANGNSISLRNNSWKVIPLNYNITQNTVIEFDFSSTREGEIHAIGFESDNSLTERLYFKVFGTQNYGVTNFDNYSSGTRRYTIPVGNFYTGSANRLVFINDNDAGSRNNSTFTNIKIFEGSCNGTSSKQLIADLSTKEPILGGEAEGMAAIRVVPNPTTDQFSFNIGVSDTSKMTMQIYNTLGQKQYETSLQTGLNQFSASNLSLSTGIYLLKIKVEGSDETVQKLIVQ